MMVREMFDKEMTANLKKVAHIANDARGFLIDT